MTDIDVEALAEALHRLGNHMATDPRDWAVDRTDAWLYGLFCGWECDDDHVHDQDCDAMSEVATQHGWTSTTVERLRRYRATIAALQAGDRA